MYTEGVGRIPTISLLYMKLMNLLQWGKFNGNWKLNSAFPCTSNIHGIHTIISAISAILF